MIIVATLTFLPVSAAAQSTPPLELPAGGRLGWLCDRFRARLERLSPHNANYILPLTYNSSPNRDLARADDIDFDRAEAKAQLSVEIPVWRDIPWIDADLSFAYTHRLFWQAYNIDEHLPVREQTFEPELVFVVRPDLRRFGMDHSKVAVGLSHQSNGRDGDLSRGWDRVYVQLSAAKGAAVCGLKTWYLVPGTTTDRDNPDIDDYMGPGELFVSYRARGHFFGVLARNNFLRTNRGALQLDWSVPLKGRLRWYVQYFNGYGESLIDYNHRVNRIGIGILADWTE